MNDHLMQNFTQIWKARSTFFGAVPEEPRRKGELNEPELCLWSVSTYTYTLDSINRGPCSLHNNGITYLVSIIYGVNIRTVDDSAPSLLTSNFSPFGGNRAQCTNEQNDVNLGPAGPQTE